MFELFIALFGGLWYAGKIASDKSALRSANKEADERWARTMAWESKFVDREFESKLRRELFGSAEKRAEVLERMRQYAAKYPEYCSHIRFVGDKYGWMHLDDVKFFAYSGKTKILFYPTFDMAMMTYGKYPATRAFHASMRHPSDLQYNRTIAWSKCPEYLTIESQIYLCAHDIPSLEG